MPKGYFKTGQPIFKTHGMSSERFYTIWKGMKQRCLDKNSSEYFRYGGRGIRLEWNSFEEFKRDMYESYQDGLTIDRIDNEANYCKKNCKWSTPKEQANNRRTNRYLTFKGKTLSMADWARELNLGYTLIKKRVIRGWTVEQTLTTKRDEKYLNKLSRNLVGVQ